MAPSSCCYDVAASMLLCAEDNSSILCLEEEEEEAEEAAAAAVGRKSGCRSLDGDFDGGVDLFPPQSEECVASLVERERAHMPRADYGERLRGGGGVDLSVRSEAIDWIWKVYTYYSFSPLTAYLAMNYLDRFLSQYELPEGKDWMTQLLSVACLSIAAKMEETAVPESLDLQIGEARFVFEAKTIQRMELLVLSTLNWRMQAVTPFSYIDYFLRKLNGGNAAPRSWLVQSWELILCIATGTGFLVFRPSEIAAAVTATVAAGVTGVVEDIAKACTHVDKERVLQCQEAIQESMVSINTVQPKPASTRRGSASSSSSVPQSPVGVLDAGCLSYKSDDTDAATIASHGGRKSCLDSSPVTSKRRKLSR
ncbi:cyclin-D4-2-like [Oryza brachyantha]|uniref:cyclin-D4-2-like n=1 Tax=Oryza brachyantha TaxID=4533 RepID=UPI001ADC35EC|nr:cyclin-D4-2-like [Oryza brachyantha]